MRYLIVRYLRKPNGQMDEMVAVTKKIKLNDAAVAAVILDFQRRRVEKAHLDGVTLPRDFDRIRDFYHRYYPKIVEELETMNRPPATVASDKDPV